MITVRRTLAYGASVIALLGSHVGTAWAGCLSNQGVLKCDGETSGSFGADGYAIRQIDVAAGARVTGGDPATVLLATAIPQSEYESVPILVDVRGAIDGLGSAGVRVHNGTAPAYSSYGATLAKITVGQGGAIKGATAIAIVENPLNTLGRALVEIDNSGSITASGGHALRVETYGLGGFSSIINRAGGLIAGISGAFGEIDNHGRIDGGALSAITTARYDFSVWPQGIVNAGVISSSSGEGTISLTGNSNLSIVNSGRIENLAIGPALSATGVDLENTATGVVAAAGGAPAIQSSGRLQIVNRGRIDGDVMTTGTESYFESLIDSTGGGVIKGDVILGVADDVVMAELSGGVLATGITGQIDAGLGSDRFNIAVRSNQTLATALVLPPSFEEVGFSIDENATLTLGPGFAPVIGVPFAISGPGTLVNAADFTTTGPIFYSDSYPFPVGTFENRGTITANLADYKPAMGIAGDFINRGTIIVNGGSGIAEAIGSASFANFGEIRATGDAVSFFTVPFENDGTIISTGGIGASIAQSSPTTTDVNRGLIRGATYGVTTSNTMLNNFGTIESGNVGVGLQSYGGIYNRAGGTITGGTAIAGNGYLGYTFRAQIYNEGVIDGDVDLGDDLWGYTTENIVVAMPGGMINGDLDLGNGGDIFVTDLINTGPGMFGGVSGSVYGDGEEQIIYRVGADAILDYHVPAPFDLVGYQIKKDVTLTLSSDTAQTAPLYFTGSGKVDLSMNLNSVDRPILTTGNVIYDPTNFGQGYAVETDVRVISRGTIAVDVTNYYAFNELGAVIMGKGTSLANVGRMTFRSTLNPNNSIINGIFGGAEFDNSGVVELDGVYGVRNVERVVNSGQFVRVGIGPILPDIANVSEISNSGSIGQIAFFDPYYTFAGFFGGLLENHAGGTVGQIKVGSAYGQEPLVEIVNDGTIGTGAAAAINALSGISLVNNSGGLIRGDILLGEGGYFTTGNDSIVNRGVIDGNLRLGDGNDSFIQGMGAQLTGYADGGEGHDSAFLDITGGGTFDTSFFDKLGNFEQVGLRGEGVVAFAGPLPVSTLALSGSLIVPEGAVLQTQGLVAITGLDSGNVVENRGTIVGDVLLGSGADRYIYRSGSVVTGMVRGGDGIDQLDFTIAGTDAKPEMLDFSRYEGFERLDIARGTGKVEGNASFQQISVSGGRLIGAPGSVLTAQQFLVASGATFGSAGRVNGDVAVSGTLSPGASPATMTINGDVALASGSNTLFEMTPTVSDAIVIDGALTIALGATLSLTGDRPLTPGAAYNLITASEGITGRFSTIDKAAAVLGVVLQRANSIQLFGPFALDPDTAPDPQAARVADYLNGMLIGGAATTGMIDAVPDLVGADGFGDAARLRLLSPEAYASSSQIGIENGLALAAAGRTMNMANGRMEAGLFTFGQWLGASRRMPGHEGLGTSKADINTRGIVGGIGYGSDVASVGAFVGYIDAKQRIGRLTARTDSNGMIAGIIGQAKSGGFEAAVTGAFDGSKAETSRALPDRLMANSRYDMHGWTVDASFGYAIDIGKGWNLKPEVAVTHIESKRDGAVEDGGSPLALVVDGGTARATYVSGQLTVRGNMKGRIQPWLSAGVRHQAEGNVQIASAAFTGSTAALSVPGAPRDRTLATVSANLAASISTMATLFLGVSSEFGADSSGQSANAGLRMRF